MSKVEVSKIDPTEKAQLVLSYATLLLSSSDVQVTEENLKKVVDASGNKIDAKLLKAFAHALQGKDVKKYFACGGGSGPATETAAPAKVEEKKEAPKKEGLFIFYLFLL